MNKRQPCGHHHSGPCGAGNLGLLAKPVPLFAPTSASAPASAPTPSEARATLETYYFVKPLPGDRWRLTCKKCGEKMVIHRFGTDAELEDEALGACSHASRCFDRNGVGAMMSTKTEVSGGHARTVADEKRDEKRGEQEAADVMRGCKLHNGTFRDDVQGWAVLKGSSGALYVADRVSGRLWGPVQKGGGGLRGYHPREIIHTDRADVVNWLASMGWSVNGQGEASPPRATMASMLAASTASAAAAPTQQGFVPRVAVARATTRLVIEEHVCSAQLSGWELRLALGHLGIQPPSDATVTVESDGQGGMKILWREKVEREEKVS